MNWPLPKGMRDLGVKTVTVIHGEGSDDEERFEVEAHIQPASGMFAVNAPVHGGDVVEFEDPRGGTTRRIAANVAVYDVGPSEVQHIEVDWRAAPPLRVAAVRRLGIEGLHTEVLAAASDLFADGHYSQAIFEALKALERRVRLQSGVDKSGRDLMTAAFGGNPPPIDVSVETGQSGKDEQEGFRFVFMGVVQGIRNPKGHELVKQNDPQRALEYLALVSVLFRRLDDAERVHA